MFTNSGFLTFHPFSLMRDEYPLMAGGPGHLMNKWMEMSEPWSTGSLVDDFSPWFRPRAHCCPHTCVPQPTPRPRLQHIMILPGLFTDPSPNGREGDEAKKGSTMSEQCQGKDTQGSEQTASASTSKDAAVDKDPEQSPWQFSVDMKDCDEVRATTENGMLMVEGRSSSDTSRRMVRYITSMPRHVSHDSLAASLSNGRLTVTQKAGAQLEGQARNLPIDVQQHKSPEAEQQQQQQQQQQQDAAEKAE